MPLRILVADDSPLTALGLQSAFAGQGDLKVVGTASTVPEMLQKLREGQFDLLLIDSSLDGRPVMEAVQQIAKMERRVRILIHTLTPERVLGWRMFRWGADGYISKRCFPRELLSAIRMVGSGNKLFTGDSLEKARNIGNWTTKPLSPREQAVFQMIAEGRTVSEIAKLMCKSVKTISTYRHRLLIKLNLKNNADVMHRAIMEFR
jgi:two-component system, NarL family, invasion response regulator UvrY